MTMKKRSPRSAIRKLNLAGCTIAVVALGGVGGWASTTRIAGAVVAPGIVVVETSVKKVQHPTGGGVGGVPGRDGDRGAAGGPFVPPPQAGTLPHLHALTQQPP